MLMFPNMIWAFRLPMEWTPRENFLPFLLTRRMEAWRWARRPILACLRQDASPSFPEQCPGTLCPVQFSPASCNEARTPYSVTDPPGLTGPVPPYPPSDRRQDSSGLGFPPFPDRPQALVPDRARTMAPTDQFPSQAHSSQASSQTLSHSVLFSTHIDLLQNTGENLSLTGTSMV